MGGGAARAEAHEHGAAQGRTSRQRRSVNFPRSGSERRRANIKKISSRRVRSGSSITKAMTAALYKKARTKCACILDFADRIEGSGLFADKASTSIAKLCRAEQISTVTRPIERLPAPLASLLRRYRGSSARRYLPRAAGCNFAESGFALPRFMVPAAASGSRHWGVAKR